MLPAVATLATVAMLPVVATDAAVAFDMPRVCRSAQPRRYAVGSAR
jgi:hypothetical protein